MVIEKTQTAGGTKLSLSGRLDANTAPQLQSELLGELNAANAVTLDFAGLTYVSSAGLRILLMGEKAAKTKDTKQTLVNVSEEIMEIFEMTGFLSVLNVER
ncbi:MAG: STAS domain-containing protein [Oscillospiraceae bacterium]|nr:STAS domain-containing protein [Oscillospiraceae bacterium]